MAGDWIKMRTSLDTDPSVVRIATGQQLDRFGVVGRLHRIWSWANEHLTDGQNVPVTAAFLDTLAESSGFAAAMREVGWLSGRDGDLSFPHFLRHNGESAKKRALDAARKRRAREMSDTCPPGNRTKGGPEKRREEKSIKKKTSSSKKFVPPTVAEVAEYCRSRGNTVDPQTFVDHYAANGWMRGKTKIKDWHACVRTWEGNQGNDRLNSGQAGRRQLTAAQQREQANADAFAVVLGEGGSTGDPEAV